MAKDRIDTVGLTRALDAARESRGWSWRQLAGVIGVTPSLLSRLRNGFKPDADGFMTLTEWLGVPAEDFLTSKRAAPTQELTVQLAPLLRARKDLSEADVQYLEEVIEATLKRVAASRKED